MREAKGFQGLRKHAQAFMERIKFNYKSGCNLRLQLTLTKLSFLHISFLFFFHLQECASWFELCFFFFFLRSFYVYFVLAMQVYIVNTQKWLILYTFAQKMVNIVQICKCVQNLPIFLCLQYKFTL